MNKKMFYISATVGALVPLSAFISCSNGDEVPNKNYQLDKEATIYVAMNKGDFAKMERPIALLKKAYPQYNVENIEGIDGLEKLKEYQKKPENKEKMISLYKLGDNDGSSQARLKEDSLFRPIDLNEIGKKEFGLEGRTFNFNDDNVFNQSILQAVNIPNEKGKVVGIPFKSQPQSLYLRDSWLNKERNILATVPKLDGAGFNVVDTKIPLSYKNVLNFIEDSGDSKHDLPGVENWSEKPSGWLSSGPLSQWQRVASIANSIDKDQESPSGAKIQNGFGFDMGLDWSVVAGIKDIYNKHTFSLGEKTLKQKITKDGFSNDAFNQVWQGFYGYYQNGELVGKNIPGSIFVDPKSQNQGGLAEVIANMGGAMTIGHPWMHGAIRNMVKAKNASDSIYPNLKYVRWSKDQNLLVPTKESDSEKVDISGLKKESEGKLVPLNMKVYDVEFKTAPLPFSEAVTESLATPKGASTAQYSATYRLIRILNMWEPAKESSEENDFSKLKLNQVDKFFARTFIPKQWGQWNEKSTLREANKLAIEELQKEPYNLVKNNDGKLNKLIDSRFKESYNSPYLTTFLGGTLHGDIFGNNAYKGKNVLMENGVPGQFRKLSEKNIWSVLEHDWKVESEKFWKKGWNESEKENNITFNKNNFKDFAKKALSSGYQTLELGSDE